MQFFKKFSLLETVIAVAILAIAAAFILPRVTQAQPYITNSASPYFGAPQYNSAFPSPLKPAQTLANQYASGTLAGSLSPIWFTNSTAGGFTNTAQSFGTNIYSSPPIMIFSLMGDSTNQVTSYNATPTNFIVVLSGTNSTCVLTWEATGH